MKKTFRFLLTISLSLLLLSGCGNSADSGAAPAADDGNPGFSDADDTGSNAASSNRSSRNTDNNQNNGNTGDNGSNQKSTGDNGSNQKSTGNNGSNQKSAGGSTAAESSGSTQNGGSSSAAQENNVPMTNEEIKEHQVSKIEIKTPKIKINTHRNDKNNPSDTLVVYYSATGSTKRVAEMISYYVDADVFEIKPKKTYSKTDLDWTDKNSRVYKEHNKISRNVRLVSTSPDNFDAYDTVYIGYPIWWGEASWVMDNFIKNNDFTGKTVIPFCTSSSSGIGDSAEKLRQMTGTGDWLEGRRFSGAATETGVHQWIDSLKLKDND